MNELKSEDVMRALECCSNPDVDACSKCPIYPFSLNWTQEECMETAIRYALALLRDKDAEIKGLVDGWSKDQDRFEKQLAEQDAEIDALRECFHTALASHNRLSGLIEEKDAEIEVLGAELSRYTENVARMVEIARAEAITEFAQRLKTFYKHLPGNTVGGSVEYHIDQIAKEMREQYES